MRSCVAWYAYTARVARATGAGNRFQRVQLATRYISRRPPLTRSREIGVGFAQTSFRPRFFPSSPPPILTAADADETRETVFIFSFPSTRKRETYAPESFESTGTAHKKKEKNKNTNGTFFSSDRFFFLLIFKLVHRSEPETGDIGLSTHVSNTFRRTIRAIAIPRTRSIYFVSEISAVTNTYDVNFLE